MGQTIHKANRLTTQPQQGTENVDEEVPAAHKHLRFGGSNEGEDDQCDVETPSKRLTCSEAEGQQIRATSR